MNYRTCRHSALIAAIACVFQSAAFAVEQDSEISSQASNGPGTALAANNLEASGDMNYSEFDVQPTGLLRNGQVLPVLEIREGGEIQLREDRVVQQPWSSESFEGNGKVQLVQYVAATRGVIRKNKPFTQALLARDYSPDELDTTIIVHLADTISFARGVVVKRMADEKAKRQAIDFVVDNEGLGLQRWGMKHKSCATILLDPSGKVVFAKDGPLSGKEIEFTIKLLERQINLSNPPLIMASK